MTIHNSGNSCGSNSAQAAAENLREQLDIAHTKYKIANERATHLGQYLNNHIEKLLEECDPQGLRAYRAYLASVEDPQRYPLPRGTPKGPPELGGTWGTEMRNTVWVPVYTTVPTKYNNVELPWPDTAVSNVPFATPLQSISSQSIWFASATLRIATFEAKNEYLQGLFGWDKPLLGRILANQLLQMSKIHATTNSALMQDAYAEKVRYRFLRFRRLIVYCVGARNICEVK